VAVSAAAILLFLNLVPLFPYLGVSASAQAEGSGVGIRAITLNLNNEGADLDAVRRLIRREKPDIVLITEFETEPSAFLRDLDDILPHRTGSGRAGVFELLLLSRLPIAETRVRRLVSRFLPVLEAKLCLPRAATDCFTIVGVHAARPGSVATRWRDVALRFAARRAAEADDGRVVVMGDFNATPWSRIFIDMLRAGRLNDAAIGSPFRSTWVGRIPLFGLPLDQVLVGHGIGVAGRRVAGSIGSDHFPVIADLTLPVLPPAR
jgi:endonuclease/exonuclease/phosphatase (EEP) superfamily protein YafD